VLYYRISQVRDLGSCFASSERTPAHEQQVFCWEERTARSTPGSKNYLWNHQNIPITSTRHAIEISVGGNPLVVS
jgi:hypothetical protein